MLAESPYSDAQSKARLHPMTLGWVVRRVLVCLALVGVLMGSFAWLTYASIDSPESVGRAEEAVLQSFAER
jgi:hypothetical protein